MKARETDTMGRIFSVLAVGVSLIGTMNGLSRSATELALEHRGCCSHHHGVCGCENDRAKCCDGELSPTCGCD